VLGREKNKTIFTPWSKFHITSTLANFHPSLLVKYAPLEIITQKFKFYLCYYFHSFNLIIPRKPQKRLWCRLIYFNILHTKCHNLCWRRHFHFHASFTSLHILILLALTGWCLINNIKSPHNLRSASPYHPKTIERRGLR